MKFAAAAIALFGSVLAIAAVAQTTTAPSRSTPAPAASGVSPGAGVNPSTGTAPGAGIVDRNTGPAAAAGNRNQAIATTTANAPQPAKGANSFTDGEARRRIESNGFTDVTDLRKDSEGIWHGMARKGGSAVKVWLDYKGNVGAS